MKRLLVAYDFTQGSARALLRALRVAKCHGAAVRVLYVTDGGASEPPDTDSAHRRLVVEARIMAEELGLGGLDLSACVRPGNAAEAILAEADAFDAALVVIGGHGAPRFRDAVFGTTATHVVRHGDRAVLVAQADGGGGYTKVMLAIDDPFAAQALLEPALEVAPAAEIVAVHAFYPTLGQTLAGIAEIERQQERLQRQFEETITSAVPGGAAQPAHVAVHAVVETGEVLSVLMKADEELQPGLLVIGTRACATFSGSHAVDAMFWCPHDLLVVPERATQMPAARPAAPAVAH